MTFRGRAAQPCGWMRLRTVLGSGRHQLAWLLRQFLCFRGRESEEPGLAGVEEEDKADSGSTIAEAGSEQRIGAILNILFSSFNISTLTVAAVY